MMRTVLATSVVATFAQDVFLAKTDVSLRQVCKDRTMPSTDALQELCNLLFKNVEENTISWTPPFAPPATFQDHIAYDLVTSWKLGADAAQLNATYEMHKSLEMLQERIPSTGAITEANWQEHVGENPNIPDALYSDYLEYYRAQIEAKGASVTLLDHLPTLADGTFGKLWHGQQMLGWGYGETRDEEMMAQGLAWMSTAFQPPAPLAEQGSRQDLMQTFKTISADGRLPVFQGDATILYGVFLGDLIANHSSVMMEYDLDVSDSVSVKDSLALTQNMEAACFQLFASYNFSSFVHIHMISSVRAVANLVKNVDAPTRATLLRREWQGLMYNYAIQSRPAPTVPEVSGDVRSWDELLSGSFAQPDYHMRELLLYAREGLSGLSENFLRFAADRGLAYISEAGYNAWNF